MGNPAIVWNGNTLSFPRAPEAYSLKPVVSTVRVEAASGMTAYQHNSIKFTFHVVVDMLTQEQEKDFWNWWFWACQGNQFSICRDTDEDSSTTLDGSSSGSTVPLTATTGMTAGDQVVVISADRTTWEIVTIQTVNAGTSIVGTEALVNSFVSGDSCRHLYYLPYARLLKPEDPVVEMEDEGATNTRRFEVTVEEDITA